MPANPKYVDGWFGSERELSVIPTPAFPFKDNPNTPDLYTREYERAYQVYPKLFLPRLAASTAWTNLLFPSQDFTDAAWSKPEVTPSLAAGTAPDGSATLNKILEKATTSVHGVSKAVAVTATATEAYVFAKGGLGRDWIRLLFTDSATTVFSAFFNITSGYVGAVTAGVTAEAVPLGNGDVMCVIRFTPAAGSGTWAFQISTDGATTSYLGDVTKGIYAWGAMLAAGSRAPYISTTSGSRSILAPDRDRVDPFAFLVEEDDPTLLNSEAAIAKRLFSRIPLVQESLTTMAITKPAFPSNGAPFFLQIPLSPGYSPSSDFAPFQPAQFYSNNFAAFNKIYGPLLQGASTFTPASSGQFTLRYKTDVTGNLNYNDSDATINAALNGLASCIADGLTWSVGNQFGTPNLGYLACSLIAGSTTTRLQPNGGFSPAEANNLFTSLIDPTRQDIYIGCVVTLPAHGLDHTKDLLVSKALIDAALPYPGVVYRPVHWSIVDADTIAFMRSYGLGYAPLVAFNYIVAGASQGARYFGNELRDYVPGPDRVKAKLVDHFYLPGVTPGIDTPEDIPTPAPLINDTDFLAAVLANTSGFINYDSDPLQQYKGRMYVQRQKQVDFADV